MQNSVTFEMNLTKKIYLRSVYSSLDFISDIGGLFGALMPLFTAILTIFNFYASYQFIMHDLFTTRQDSKEEDEGQDELVNTKGKKKLKVKTAGSFKRFVQEKTVHNNVQWNSCKTMCLNLRTFVRPRFLCLCCSPNQSRSQRLESKGFRHVLKEVSIVNILKQIRVLQGVVS